ncbi:MAG: cobyrinate a,c-diamide synthase [Clostridia bacterium]|nr:cobyrinate a,c-diamide synthase [Clostridia bacterium]
MTKFLPRVLIGGTSSGSGKTTAVCAILTLLKRRGIGVTACKCGPDYIDPMFHESVLSIQSANLDPFFCDDNLLRSLLAESGDALTVIEGVMGYYDGTGESGTDNSTYTVAAKTDTPVILVVNAKGASTSLLAVIEGFLRFVSDSRICGVIFNNITAMTYAMMKKQLDKRFAGRIRAVGYIPKLPENCILGSRHLGLVTAAEIGDLREKLDKIADLCAETLDIDVLSEIAHTAEPLEYTLPIIPELPAVKIAVVRDAAFCFYYKDTLKLFEKMGTELVSFSPLADEPLPADADGLLLGGGYPELYADMLEKNEISRGSIRRAIEIGMPTIAECGGFQYLGQKLDGRKMCGALQHDSVNTGKLVRFGYITLTSHSDGLFGKAGSTFRGHEFHYYDSTDNGNGFTAVKQNGRSWDCAVYTDTLYAGYPHLFLPANIPAAEAFYKKCLAYKEKKS